MNIYIRMSNLSIEGYNFKPRSKMSIVVSTAPFIGSRLIDFDESQIQIFEQTYKFQCKDRSVEELLIKIQKNHFLKGNIILGEVKFNIRKIPHNSVIESNIEMNSMYALSPKMKLRFHISDNGIEEFRAPQDENYDLNQNVVYGKNINIGNGEYSNLSNVEIDRASRYSPSNSHNMILRPRRFCLFDDPKKRQKSAFRKIDQF